MLQGLGKPEAGDMQPQSQLLKRCAAGLRKGRDSLVNQAGGDNEGLQTMHGSTWRGQPCTAHHARC